MSAEAETNTEAAAATVKLVTVIVGEQMIGIPIEKVRDVFVPTGMTNVPLAPPMIAGLVNLRGKVVTVISLRSMLGFPAYQGSQMTIGIEWRGEAFGLLVDEVGEVIDLADDTLESNPPNMDPRWTRFSTGIRRLENRLLVQLDTESLFDMPAAA